MGRLQPKTARQQALELSAQRDSITAEIDAIVSVLTAPGAPGISGNLVDAEGFPRADVDIATVRAQRHRLAVLRTDYKNVSDELERALYAALPPADGPEDSAASAAAALPQASASGDSSNGASVDTTNGAQVRAPVGSASDRARVPFALVDRVESDSPAAEAQLQVGDRVAAFGAVSLRALHTVAAAMSALPATVRGHIGRPVDLIVHRGDGADFSALTLTITPRPWSGTGMLGCHVTPLNVQEDARYKPEVAVAVARR